MCGYALLVLCALCVLCAPRVHAAVCTHDCRFELVVRQRRSMTYADALGFTYNVAWNDTAQRLQVAANSFHQPIDVGRAHPSDPAVVGTFVDADDVITTDGFTRNVFVINDQFPGPTLEVLEGAEVRMLTLEI